MGDSRDVRQDGGGWELLDRAPIALAEIDLRAVRVLVEREIAERGMGIGSILESDPGLALKLYQRGPLPYTNAAFHRLWPTKGDWYERHRRGTPAHLAAVRQILEMVAGERESCLYEYQGEVDGRLRSWQVVVTPLERSGRWVVRALYSGTDVTDLWEAREAKADVERWAGQLLDAAPVSVIELDLSALRPLAEEAWMEVSGGGDLAAAVMERRDEVMRTFRSCRVHYANALARRIYGSVTPESLVGLSADAGTDSQIRRVAGHFSQLLLSQGPVEYRLPLRLPEGGSGVYHFRYHVVGWEGGFPTRVLYVGVDVTSLTTAEAELSRALSKYDSLFDLAPVMLREENIGALYDYFDELSVESGRSYRAVLRESPELVRSLAKHVRPVRANRASMEFHGTNETEVILERAWDGTGERLGQQLFEALTAMERGDRYGPFMSRVRDSNGRLRWLLVSLAGTEFEGGRPVQYLVASLDVTRQMLTQEAHRLISQEVGKARPGWEGVFALLGGLNMSLGSEEAVLTLYSEVGSRVWRVWSEAECRYEEVSERVGAGQKTGGVLRVASLGSGDGEHGAVWTLGGGAEECLGTLGVRFRGLPWANEDLEALLGLFGTALATEVERQDLAAAQVRYSERLEEEVRLRTEELAELNRELEAFSYSVSHDLRAPIRHVLAYTRDVLDRSGSGIEEESREDLERVLVLAKRMGDLTADLLRFSQLGRTGVRRSLVEMSVVVDQAWRDVVGLRARGAGGQGHFGLGKGEILPTQADAELARTVWANLFSNAVKYSGGFAKAVVRAGSEERGGRVWYWVEDEGIGFPQEYESVVFQPFRRLAGSEGVPGTGVGLATVERIVRKHGGVVRAKSSPGEGARFEFTFDPEPG